MEKLWLFLRGNSLLPSPGSRAIGPSGMSLRPGGRDAVESFPRRNESWGDSLQKAACQPPLFFLSQQCYGNRGELGACQSCSPLIPPVQISHHGFALSFPRLLSLLGLASMSFLSLPLSLKLPFSNRTGKPNRLGYLSHSGGYFCLYLMEQTRGEAGAVAPFPPRRHLLWHPDTACCCCWTWATWCSGIPPGALPEWHTVSWGMPPSPLPCPFWRQFRTGGPREPWRWDLCTRYSRVPKGNSPKLSMRMKGQVPPWRERKAAA